MAGRRKTQGEEEEDLEAPCLVVPPCWESRTAASWPFVCALSRLFLSLVLSKRRKKSETDLFHCIFFSDCHRRRRRNSSPSPSLPPSSLSTLDHHQSRSRRLVPFLACIFNLKIEQKVLLLPLFFLHLLLVGGRGWDELLLFLEKRQRRAGGRGWRGRAVHFSSSFSSFCRRPRCAPNSKSSLARFPIPNFNSSSNYFSINHH